MPVLTVLYCIVPGYMLPIIILLLLAGIGVDDIFVIVQAWSNLEPMIHQTQPIAERIGLTLKHAVSDHFIRN